MNDHKFIVALIAGSTLCIGFIAWGAIKFGNPSRSTHTATAVEAPPKNPQLDELSTQIRVLDQRLAALAEAEAAGAGQSLTRKPATATEGEILVKWVDAPLVLDPANTIWVQAPVTTVALQAQNQAVPMADKVSVSQVRVQGLTNGRQIAWRVAWKDVTPNRLVDAARFSDAVAVQLPLKSNAAYTMGATGFPVQILHWKALWQQDLDVHFQDVEDLYPNYWTDLYWFASGPFPYRVPDAFSRPESRDWFIAYKAGNPMSNIERAVSAEELTAEGFGSLTHQSDSVTVARGTWQNGEWSVVFLRPMETIDPDDFQFIPGTRDTVGFAVWDGAADNVGARKQHSLWVVFEVQK